MLVSCQSVAKEHVSLSGPVVSALEDVSFELAPGQLLSVVGPSGSGKSTLLNLIAGVYQPTRGTIRFADTSLRIGYVLQNNALFPWLTVRQNLTYSHDLRRVPRRESDPMAADLCAQLSLEPTVFLGKYPRELSGGEQRRVAIGMAVATSPDLLLLDEPGSQLDYEAKWAIQLLVQEISMLRSLSVICVTHDLEEAVFLGDRVMMLRAGRVSDVLDIELTRPRLNEARSSDKFNVYRRRLMPQHGN